MAPLKIAKQAYPTLLTLLSVVLLTVSLPWTVAMRGATPADRQKSAEMRKRAADPAPMTSYGRPAAQLVDNAHVSRSLQLGKLNEPCPEQYHAS